VGKGPTLQSKIMRAGSGKRKWESREDRDAIWISAFPLPLSAFVTVHGSKQENHETDEIHEKKGTGGGDI